MRFMEQYGYWFAVLVVLIVGEALSRWLKIPEYFRPEPPDAE